MHSTENTPVWDDGGWEALPPLVGDVAADVCVVGLGGSGLACVGELLAGGLSVVGLDAAGVGAGAAGRNGGFLLAGLAAFYHHAVARLGRARAAAIYRRTLEEIERMAAETPEAVRLVGSLRIAASPDEQEDCRAHLAALRADGLPGEPYAGPEGRGLLLPSDGGFQPLRRCRALARRAIAGGARLYEGTRALSCAAGAVRCAGGVVRARSVVVAVDGGLELLLPALAGRVRTARLQMLATAPDPVRLPRPVYTRWGYDYWQQLPDGRVVLGGCRDRFAGQEWTAAGAPSAEVQAAMEALLRDRVGVRAAVTHRWAAAVAYHVGSVLPLVEELGPGLWAIGAYSGTGNVLGAICGRGVGRMVARGDDALLRGLLRG